MCTYLVLCPGEWEGMVHFKSNLLDRNHRTSCLLSKPASWQLPQVTETKPGPVIPGVLGWGEDKNIGWDQQGKEAGHWPL